ncbi:hypothetical protein BABINDRAFT_163714 [Babjeviella inositovora NRRL Y-12698]|uniref:Uncharacterized protein n=1 Tax=Babjeviella inositovora NRRL Y-12698 TaxID=984486 RepID=A0A1E3QHN9_9ASCO|nr:uncharacterized protein BABINDRAFT_163714 [Babjeviella inositovora NRRL Y-12698]ODQ77209.1 hypothetical protein BABINDRAFT_163714 [Babjeviella inositovora NRRL Y-12698]
MSSRRGSRDSAVVSGVLDCAWTAEITKHLTSAALRRTKPALHSVTYHGLKCQPDYGY